MSSPVPENFDPRSRMAPLAVLPVFFKLNGRRVVLAGGSDAAAWKAELLAAAGAEVHVYADQFAEGFARLIDQSVSGIAAGVVSGVVSGRIVTHTRDWQPNDLDDAALAVGAITDDGEAHAFAAAAKAAGVPVNVVDRPEFCDFQFGALVNRSPLVIGISTDGAAPVFGQAVRSAIEGLLPLGLKKWAEAAKTWRGAAKQLGSTMAERRRVWERFSAHALNYPDGEPTEALLTGFSAKNEVRAGTITLISAPLDDPESLTLRAVRALRTADTLVLSPAIDTGVADFARRESRRILEKPASGDPVGMAKEVINLALTGERVVWATSPDRVAACLAALDTSERPQTLAIESIASASAGPTGHRPS